jgi:hypothetical protein
MYKKRRDNDDDRLLSPIVISGQLNVDGSCADCTSRCAKIVSDTFDIQTASLPNEDVCVPSSDVCA